MLQENNFSHTNTYNRKKIYHFMELNLPFDLSLNTANMSIRHLVAIACCTQVYTITKQMPILIPMVNHIITWYVKNNHPVSLTAEDIKVLTKKFKNDFII
jgi:hypothetical protein